MVIERHQNQNSENKFERHNQHLTKMIKIEIVVEWKYGILNFCKIHLVTTGLTTNNY